MCKNENYKATRGRLHPEATSSRIGPKAGGASVTKVHSKVFQSGQDWQAGPLPYRYGKLGYASLGDPKGRVIFLEAEVAEKH